MTVGAWVGCIFGAIIVICIGGFVITTADLSKGGIVATLLICAFLIGGIFGLGFWACNKTEAGMRAMKTQQSNFGGGLNRTVTIYSYDGTPIKSWTGRFDVTENDQETWFDIDGKRVIIQGGIVINEEK